MTLNRRGVLLALSSPSGAGKTSVARSLLAQHPHMLTMSTSVTTRSPRPGEQDGVDYHFKTVSDFMALRDQGSFLESAEVFGNYYGTLEAPVNASLGAGMDVLFDVDWQGVQQLRHRMARDLVSIFLLPPSLAVLGERLKSRGQDTAAVIADRMSKAQGEISHWAEYDYVLINDDLPTTIAQVDAILQGERCRRERQINLAQVVQEMLS